MRYLILNINENFTLLCHKDPCKKCIVQPACSMLCKEKIQLDIMLYPYNSWFVRFLAGVVLFVPLSMVVYTFVMIYKGLT